MLSRRAIVLSMGAAALPTFAKAGSVEIGVCGLPNDFTKADAFGFDYYEPSGSRGLRFEAIRLSRTFERKFWHRVSAAEASTPIRTMQVVGDQPNLDALGTYLDSTL